MQRSCRACHSTDHATEFSTACPMHRCTNCKQFGHSVRNIRMAASPGFFGVFFSGHFQIHGNLEIRFSCGVYCGDLQRRIQVHRRCRPDEPARVVKPHRKHAQNTTGEVRGEFQRRRVCACCRSRNTHRGCALLRRFHSTRHTRLLLSLVQTTITVDSHTHNEGACGVCVLPQHAPF